MWPHDYDFFERPPSPRPTASPFYSWPRRSRSGTPRSPTIKSPSLTRYPHQTPPSSVSSDVSEDVDHDAGHLRSYQQMRSAQTQGLASGVAIRSTVPPLNTRDELIAQPQRNVPAKTSTVSLVVKPTARMVTQPPRPPKSLEVKHRHSSHGPTSGQQIVARSGGTTEASTSTKSAMQFTAPPPIGIAPGGPPLSAAAAQLLQYINTQSTSNARESTSKPNRVHGLAASLDNDEEPWAGVQPRREDPLALNGVNTGTERIELERHELSFVILPNTPDAQTIPFVCYRTRGTSTILQPPITASTGKAGDLYVHVHLTGVQRWVFKDGSWQTVKVGDAHPTFGKGRVLSQRQPVSTKLPNWVLGATLSTYRSRDREVRRAYEML
ncbi:hypothetical protein FRB99_004477 [Tulasnella sp. 403]|nr:hypothetical protein FRB99_004477 [Tulasnella sp. 403]